MRLYICLGVFRREGNKILSEGRYRSKNEGANNSIDECCSIKIRSMQRQILDGDIWLRFYD